MGSALVIVEDIRGAAKAIRHLRSNKATAVAFSVGVKIFFERRAVDCFFPHDVADMPDLNTMGRENIERVKNICTFLDTSFQMRLEQYKGLAIFSASNFYIKTFFDAAYSSYYILKRMIDRLHPEEIILFRPEYELWQLLTGQCAHVPTVASALLENVFGKEGVRVRVVSSGRSNESMLLPWLRSCKRRAANYLGQGAYRDRNIPGVINLCNSHDIAYLCDRVFPSSGAYSLAINGLPLAAHSANLLDIKLDRDKGSEDAVSRQISAVFAAARLSDEYRGFFAGSDAMFDFVNRCLEAYTIKTLGELLPNIGAIRQRIMGLGASVVVTSNCRMAMPSALVLGILRSLGVPIVSYQEGGGAGYLDWPAFNLDTALADYFLVYGRGVADSPYVEGKEKVVPVGSLRLETIRGRLKRRCSSGRAVYVVLDVLKYNAYQHYPFNGGFFSQAYYHQRSILDLLSRFDGVKFVIKTVRGKKVLYERYQRGPVSIETAPLETLLNDAGAFILDSATTALQECLLTDKPIALLYNKDGLKFEPEALKLLRKRVRVADEAGQHVETICALISDMKNGSPMARQREFLERYCIMEKSEDCLKDFFANTMRSR